MSLRDWLAGKALTGTISNVDAMNKIFAGLDDGEDLTMAVAKSSYEFADAMLKAREVKP
ncbi:hypothetical protein [Aureimonas altamirensis]|nr:hypothetical protein [Aureimonas altamirensis]